MKKGTPTLTLKLYGRSCIGITDKDWTTTVFHDCQWPFFAVFILFLHVHLVYSLDIFRLRSYKFFSCSIKLSMKFVMLINFRLLTIANSFLLNIAEHENFSANKYENAN